VREAGRNPLVQAVFALQNAPLPEPLAGGVRFELAGVENRASRFDLWVSLWNGAAACKVSWSTIPTSSPRRPPNVGLTVSTPARRGDEVGIVLQETLQAAAPFPERDPEIEARGAVLHSRQLEAHPARERFRQRCVLQGEDRLHQRVCGRPPAPV